MPIQDSPIKNVNNHSESTLVKLTNKSFQEYGSVEVGMSLIHMDAFGYTLITTLHIIHSTQRAIMQLGVIIEEHTHEI